MMMPGGLVCALIAPFVRNSLNADKYYIILGSIPFTGFVLFVIFGVLDFHLACEWY